MNFQHLLQILQPNQLPHPANMFPNPNPLLALQNQVTPPPNFKFNSKKPGIVTCSKEVGGAEIEINILKENVTFHPNAVIIVITPVCSLKHQCYLFEEV